MKIKLLNAPQYYCEIIYNAGRNCYGMRDAADKIGASQKNMGEFAEKLIKLGHESVLEHVYVVIYAYDVSRSFLAQITRHRLMAYSVKSQHYVKHEDFRYKDLKQWGKDELDIAVNKTDYWLLMEEINKLYKQLIRTGVPHYIAREVLPNACLTDMVISANVREWRHVINMRITPNNTPEIQEFAKVLLRTLYLEMSELFSDMRNKYESILEVK